MRVGGEWFGMLALGGCLVIDGSSGAPSTAKPGVIASIFGWPPVLWTIRIVLLIVILAGAFLVMLLFVRFFRRDSIKTLWKAPLPHFKEFGGKFAGMEATAKLADANVATEAQLAELNKRIDELVVYVQSVVAVAEEPETDQLPPHEQA